VSTSWQSLAYDGQLWSLLDLRSFHRIPSGSLLQLTKFAGSFVQQLNLSGHVHLSPETMESLADQLCIVPHGLGGLPFTQLTTLNLRGCSAISTRVLHHLLVRSPMLQRLSARGLSAVTNTTCDILAVYCPRLEALDLGRCSNLDASGLRSFFRAILERGECTHLTELRVSGMRNVNSDLLTKIARGAPDLEVLDLSYAKGLHDGGLRAFVTCSEADVADERVNKVLLSSRQAGHDPADPTRYWRRVMRIRHLNLSFCTSLTDAACRHLAHALPRLEFLELAGIGAGLREEGLTHLLRTTSLIRKLDLEDASSLEDGVLDTLTPPPVSTWPRRAGPFPGDLLEHLSVSHSVVSDDALVRLIEGCTKLRVLEADNTRMSGRALQTFVKSARARGIHDALVVAGDNRNVGESSVRELQGVTRPRLGWRAWDARKLNYLDSRDGEGLEDVGQDECDSARVVVKTFYSWQTVDAVRAARKRRARSRRRASWEDGEEGSAVRSARWWSPGGARRGGTRTPTLLDARDGGEACVIM
jgi:F-box and leucine-rich repeat protein 2/20